MFNKKTVSTLVAVLVSAFAGSAFAAETAANIDVSKCKVEYPKVALMNQETGVTSLALLVGTDGSVTDAKVEQSSGSKTLDKAAVKGLSSCKFKPGSKDGSPAATWAKVAYAWTLD